MSVTWSIIQQLPTAFLKEDDVDRQFVRKPTEHSCTECERHSPHEITIANIQAVAVRLKKIEGKELHFRRVDGARFTHPNDGGWIHLKTLWPVVPELEFSPGLHNPVSDRRERLRYRFDIYQILTASDVGKKVVRSQPHESWVLSWDFIPLDEKLGDVQQKLTEISGKYIRIYSLRTQQQDERILPNDGRWITEEFFRNYLEEHPDAVIPVKDASYGDVDCTIS